MTVLAEPAVCIRCHAALPPDSPEGLCPQCLLALGLMPIAPDLGPPTGRDAPDNLAVSREWIGPYRLLRVLGEGGMGVVYLAEQAEPLRRQAAIKIIKPGMDTRAVIARFEAERQALALMDHPSIASVYDAGSTEDGRPFFVMEYVAGLPLTTYCDRYRLSTRDRIALFIHKPLCDRALDETVIGGRFLNPASRARLLKLFGPRHLAAIREKRAGHHSGEQRTGNENQSHLRATGSGWAHMAERGRFELPNPLRGCRFSRPVQSTALPPLRLSNATIGGVRFWLPTRGPCNLMHSCCRASPD